MMMMMCNASAVSNTKRQICWLVNVACALLMSKYHYLERTVLNFIGHTYGVVIVKLK